jgi:dynein heavy chain
MAKQLKEIPLPLDPTQYDDRITWLRSKLESGLMVEFTTAKSSSTNQDIFTDCLERNDRSNLRGLVDFLDDNTSKTSLIFWVESVSVAIEQHARESVVTDAGKSLEEDSVIQSVEGEEVKKDEAGLGLCVIW